VTQGTKACLEQSSPPFERNPQCIKTKQCSKWKSSKGARVVDITGWKLNFFYCLS